MTLTKGTKIRATFNRKIYEVAGFWRDEYVFAPIDKDEEQCLIYTPSEVNELLSQGEFEVF